MHDADQVRGLAGTCIAQPGRETADVEAGDGAVAAQDDRAAGETAAVGRVPDAKPRDIGEARGGTGAGHAAVC